jgi:mannosyltransferase
VPGLLPDDARGAAGTPPDDNPSDNPHGDPSAGSGPADPDATTRGVPPEIIVLTLVAVAAGIALRFVARSPLWLDEALSVNIAKLPLGDIPEALHHDGHPPLYYALLHGWMQVVGTSDTAVRALSGVIAVVTLPLAYLAGRRRGGPVLGWITLGIFAVSPFVLRYATETRMYSMVTFLVLAGYLLLDDLTRRGRAGWGRVAGLTIVVAALLYSHYWTMWLLGAVGLVLLVVWRRAESGSPTRTGTQRALLALVGGGVLFLPWVPTVLYQSKHTGTPWAGPLRPGSVLGSTLTDFGGGDFKDAQFVGGVLLVLVLLGIFGRALDSRRIELDLRTTAQFRAEAAVLALTLLIGMLVSYATWSAFVTRYASAFLPIFLLVVAAGITRFTGRWVRSGVFLVVLALLGFGCVYNLSKPRTQAGPITTKVAEKAKPDDVVVYCPDQLGPAELRLMPAGLRHVGFPTLTPPDRIDWVDYGARNSADPAAYAQQVLDYAGPGHGIFVVWSGGYKTHEGTCERFLDALSQGRPGAQTVVSEDGDTYYEHANLWYYPST